MHRLLRIGFQSVGYWEPHPKKADGLTYYLRTAAPHPHTLYAFVLDGEVKYVGKTTRTLAARMDNYVRGPGEPEPGNKRSIPSPKARSTNARVGRAILDALRQGAMVEIYALPDVELHRYGDFHLNLAAGLEDSIIAVLQPEWNGGKKSRIDGMENVVDTPAVLPQPEPIPAIDGDPVKVLRVKVGATYFDKGFSTSGWKARTCWAPTGRPSSSTVARRPCRSWARSIGARTSTAHRGSSVVRHCATGSTRTWRVMR